MVCSSPVSLENKACSAVGEKRGKREKKDESVEVLSSF